jgi:restriction endonuclease Mrr
VDGSKWENRVQAAREHLKKNGLLEGKMRGYWSLTQAGHLEAVRQEKLEIKFREMDEKLGINWDDLSRK